MMAAARQPFGFTGREHELDAGLTYHRDRYMQPATGLWTQADRLISGAVASDAAQNAAAQVPQQAWRLSAMLAATFANMLPNHEYAYAADGTLTDPLIS